MQSYTIPATADNYEEVRSMLKAQSGGKIISPGNRFFSETYDIMRDFYDGKITCDEVKNIFKEYVYHAFGRPEGKQDTAEAQESGYQSTMSFLKNFNITWNYGSNRFEFLSVK